MSHIQYISTQPPNSEGHEADNVRASGSGQSGSPCTGHCLELLTSISSVVDRNAKMMDVVVSHIVHRRRHPGAIGATTSPSTAQDSEEIDETALRPRTRRFRPPARPKSRKDADELRVRVSLTL
jgi:hypothetical protein